jgi:hypothetical protein
MAQVISTLDNAISKLNSLLEFDSTAPSSGDEDYTVWTDLLNTAINLWEFEEGVLWRELFVKLADAATGDKTVTAGDYSYSVPTNFRFPASGFVWLGSGDNKTPFKIIKQSDLQLYENSTGNWCYFLMDTTPTLEFNPNCTLPNGYTISYNYYKQASALATGSDTFEMSDPMFAVFYALSVLKQEEGDPQPLNIAQQKLSAMITRNEAPAPHQEDSLLTNSDGDGFGV